MVYNQNITIWMPEFVENVKSSIQHLWLEANMLNSLANRLEDLNTKSGGGGIFDTGNVNPITGNKLYGFASKGVIITQGKKTP